MVRFSADDVLTEDEIDKLISAATSHDKDLITIIIFTGMRAGEVEHFDKSWIKWQNEEIIIPKQFNGWSPKTKNSSRHIPINTDQRLTEALRAFFYHFEKVPWKRTQIWRKVKKAATKAKIEHKVYPHCLRATYLTMLAHKGVSASTLQHVAGWANLNVAERYIQSTGARATDEVRRKWKT